MTEEFERWLDGTLPAALSSVTEGPVPAMAFATAEAPDMPRRRRIGMAVPAWIAASKFAMAGAVVVFAATGTAVKAAVTGSPNPLVWAAPQHPGNGNGNSQSNGNANGGGSSATGNPAQPHCTPAGPGQGQLTAAGCSGKTPGVPNSTNGVGSGGTHPTPKPQPTQKPHPTSTPQGGGNGGGNGNGH